MQLAYPLQPTFFFFFPFPINPEYKSKNGNQNVRGEIWGKKKEIKNATKQTLSLITNLIIQHPRQPPDGHQLLEKLAFL